MGTDEADRAKDCCTAGVLFDAARRLYEAEVALHIARQTRADRWIAAASEKLHAAVVAYDIAV